MVLTKHDNPEPDAFNMLASYVQKWLPFPDYDEKQFWWTDLMHKWLIVVHLTAISPWTMENATAETLDIRRCGKYAAKEGLRFVEDVILEVDPEAAAGPLAEFKQWNREYNMG
ncbi:hypothetical protein JCM5353_002809 [Sporobolomyces roseus]